MKGGERRGDVVVLLVGHVLPTRSSLSIVALICSDPGVTVNAVLQT